jgi:GNAT superfamily N-acetyltransferase
VSAVPGGPRPAEEWRRGDFAVSDDPARLDLDVVHGYLTRSYWAAGIPRETVARSIAGSLPFGLYQVGKVGAAAERQVGFARVVTDRATFAYLADVFVLEEHRGRGLSLFLIEAILAHPDLQGLRRWHLVTRDAQGLYSRFGFAPVDAPERHMERRDPEVYHRPDAAPPPRVE